MYACLHLPSLPTAPELFALAAEFSPAVEHTSSNTLVFSITPLRRLIGPPSHIAAEICRLGNRYHLKANLAIASNPDTAILLASHRNGVTLSARGEEHLKLASIPLSALFTTGLLPVAISDQASLEVLSRWGLKTCEDLASLPELGIVERLGASGVYLRNLAKGTFERPLRLSAPPPRYQESLQLEDSVVLLEPLLFLLSGMLNDLCSRLRTQSQAARLIEAEFELEGHSPYRCELEFPAPLEDSRVLLKLLQLHLERHPPPAPIRAFTLRLEPVDPHRVQSGIFLPPTPSPDKLQVTLTRIASLVGPENVGSPVLLDTHRPDAFEMTTPRMDAPCVHSITPQPDTTPNPLRLVLRLFRPPRPAQVKILELVLQHLEAPGIKGKVLRSAGPWKTSGEWWSPTSWNRAEWDVALEDGALYRIYQESSSGAWFVHGVYD
jgi:protein ImuB